MKKINKLGDFQWGDEEELKPWHIMNVWGDEEELKPWHIMNVVPLIWQVPDFQMCFSFSILQKLKQLNKTVTKINLPIPSQNTS